MAFIDYYNPDAKHDQGTFSNKLSGFKYDLEQKDDLKVLNSQGTPVT